MRGLTVLSPHRDDAVFSLGLALSRWSERRVRLAIVNFFTISAYAPWTATSLPSEITELRAQEDRRALQAISRHIKNTSLMLLDAPLRLNISPASISAPENSSLQPPGETHSLMLAMRKYFLRGLVMAPFALGRHIDHRAVYAAAVLVRRPQRLAFYEDLPYATWTSEEELAVRVHETENETGVALRPLVIRHGHAGAQKLRLISRYQSQITRSEAKAIGEYAARYGGGERIWIPRSGSEWRSLVRETMP